MLQPSRTKYRKQQKGRNTGIATRGNKVSFGEYGLKALGRGRLTARQLEAARRTLSRHIKRGGRVSATLSQLPCSSLAPTFPAPPNLRATRPNPCSTNGLVRRKF